MRARILTVGETEVYIHAATILFAVYALLTGAWPVMLVASGSILLHELAHGAAAWLCGQPPRELELTPLGAVLRLEDEERLPPMKRLIMLAAGPAMTLLLCWLSLAATARGWLPAATGRTLFAANLAILMVNLLPALPLDGGRMLSLLLSLFFRQETVRRVMRIAGTVLGLAAIGISGWTAWRFGSWNWSLAAAGCFLMYSAATATTTQALAELRMLMDRKIAFERQGYAPLRRIAIAANMPLRRAIRLLSPRAMTDFCLIAPGTMQMHGTITEQQMIAAYMSHPAHTCLDVLRAENLENSAEKG